MPTLGESSGDDRDHERYSVAGGPKESESKKLMELEQYWTDRVTYPTGKFNPAWLRNAAEQHNAMAKAVPAGSFERLTNPKPFTVTTKVLGAKGTKSLVKKTVRPQPSALSTTGWTSLGPAPLNMTGCSGCFNYTTTEGRVNDIVVDATTTTQGSIIAYAASVGGGIWKTTNCCNTSTNWTVTTDDPLLASSSVDSIAIDPNNHNTVYVGTGDLNFGSFGMGSTGIWKTTDGGNTWSVLGASVFGPDYLQPTGYFPQYQAVGKVRVDPNNSNNVVAGTKTGLYFSRDAGNTWTQCATDSFGSQRHDITGLELTDMGGGVTRVLAAVGTRGFPTYVQYDLGNNGANGLYAANMTLSGCPTFSPITTNANGFVYGTTVSKSPYVTGANMNADSGNPCNYPYLTAANATYCGNGSAGGTTTNGGTVNNLGRIDIAVAPSNPNVIYAQVCSINWNSDTGSSSGCNSVDGCQLGMWVSINGGGSWSFMNGSAGPSLAACSGATGSGSAGGGDYDQNWYDQAVKVDPNNPFRVWVSTFDVWMTSCGANCGVGSNWSQWYDTTCGYSFSGSAGPVHVDQHGLAFVPGSSDLLIATNDGGVHATSNASQAALNTLRPTWSNLDTGINAIEFYSGDISGNFATSSPSYANGGAQDNASESVSFTSSPTGPVAWQTGIGGDGFTARIDPQGTGPTQAAGTITLVTGGATAGQQFVIGGQTFTFQTAARSGAGQVTLNSSTTTEGAPTSSQP